jgi:hypothetical protein
MVQLLLCSVTVCQLDHVVRGCILCIHGWPGVSEIVGFFYAGVHRRGLMLLGNVSLLEGISDWRLLSAVVRHDEGLGLVRFSD